MFMTELQKTPLYAAHCALDARLAGFSGWMMPLHYGSQLDEHRAVRADAGMFDVSHMGVIDLRDPDGLGRARAFLRRALANNVDKLKSSGRALYTCMLNPDGGVRDDLLVYFFNDDFFRLVVNATTAEKDSAWLNQLNTEKEYGLTIVPRRDLAIIAVQGPNARAKVWRALPKTRAASETLTPFSFAVVPELSEDELMLARTGYSGEDGFELIIAQSTAEPVWTALCAAGARPCGLGARDTLRIEAGMNLYGQEMDEQTSPLDSGLGWSVDLQSERDFIGKSALLRDGCRAAFVGLVLCDAGSGILRTHQPVLTAYGQGEITSGTFSPTLQQSIAFARVPRGVKAGEIVQVRIRNKICSARVVTLPFVRHGKVLVNKEN